MDKDVADKLADMVDCFDDTRLDHAALIIRI